MTPRRCGALLWQLEKRLIGMRDICLAVDSVLRTNQLFGRVPAWQSATGPVEGVSQGEIAWLAEWIIEAKV